MDELKDVRWKQRFTNFEKSYNLLNQYINQPIETELERAGIIQFFEISFELSWKLMKDYLEAQELSVKSPRETIKQAYQIGLIDDGHVWIDALSDRNLTVHTYDEKMAKKMVDDITKMYFPELKKLYDKLVKEL
ncbi:nucleotidyltransferase substrate binding protein [Clostridiaceae bacterium 35-E11]